MRYLSDVNKNGIMLKSVKKLEYDLMFVLKILGSLSNVMLLGAEVTL